MSDPINDCGELTALIFTAGNVHDIQPVPELLNNLFGKISADKGYLSKALQEQLAEKGMEIIVKVRKNMKYRILLERDDFLLQKRAYIETVVDQLKNIAQIEHTRHRAGTGFLSNALAALAAYCHQPKKPSVNLRVELQNAAA